MQKIVKKGTAVLLVVVLAVVLQVQGYAANLGTLRYWESDSDSVARWGAKISSIPSITYCDKLNSNSEFSFITGMETALSQWGTVMNKRLFVSTAEYPDSVALRFYGGTYTQIKNKDVIPDLPSGVTGITYYAGITTEGTWTYGSSTKTGQKITKVIGAIFDLDRTTDQYKETCLHEFGHALGWRGHSPNSSNVMYAYASSITTLTNADKRQIRQIYYK